MPESRTVSIIIPVLNAEKYITQCLNAITDLDTPRNEFEVLLIDNGSSDGSLKMAEKFIGKLNLHIFKKPEFNISALRNYGVEHAQGDIVAFLDVDCIIGKHWLNKGIEPLKIVMRIKEGNKEKEVAMSGSPYKIPLSSSWVGKAWSLNSSNIQVEGPIEWLPSGNMFVKKGIFIRLGGFDERLKTNEDYDFCYRLREAGYAIFSDPEIEAIHLGTPQTILAFFKKELWHGRDVFRVFLESGIRLKNIKAVSFALFYVFSIIGILVGLFFALNDKIVFPLFFFICALFFLPLSLAIIKLFQIRRFGFIIFQLTILYLIYGLARAFCILNFNWLISKNRRESTQ